MQRSIFINTLGRPNALARVADGGFVIAGDKGTAWAVGTDSEGRLRWEYTEDFDKESPGNGDQGAFRSAVPLPDGSVMVCGEQRVHGTTTALLLKIGQAGEVIERRLVFPKGAPDIVATRIGRCLKWGSGLAAIGKGFLPAGGGPAWLMAMDANGKEEWQTVLPDEVGDADAVEAGDGGLYTARVGGTRIVIARISASGKVLDVRSRDGFTVGLLRPMAPTAGLDLIVYEEKRAIHVALDEGLQVRNGKPVELVRVDDGRGFVLTDQSLLLFGTAAYGGSFRAAVARTYTDGTTSRRLVLMAPTPKGASADIGDAIPIGPGEFVCAWRQVTASRDSTGVVLTWIRVD